SSLSSHHSPPELHSYPTRRSSDLNRRVAKVAPGQNSTSDLTSFNNRGKRIQYHNTRCTRPCAGNLGVRISIGEREGNRSANLNGDRKSTRLNSSHVKISYAVFCLK